MFASDERELGGGIKVYGSTLKMRIDKAGNLEPAKSLVVVVDDTLPAVNTPDGKPVEEEFYAVSYSHTGYDSIAAVGRLSRQISANNDAMIASIDRQLAASRTAGSGAGAGTGPRSSTDNFDDYIRGVDTVEDPYRGTPQHSFKA